jgi:unspecific monooxygenase
MLAGLYTKTSVQASEDIKEISQNVVIKHLLPIIEESARDQKAIDALEISLATAMDFITGYLFGLSHSSRFLQDETVRKGWLDAHQKSKGHSFWYLELPGVTVLLSKLGINLVPLSVVSSTKKVKDLCLQLLNIVEGSSDSYSTGASLKPPTEKILSTRPIVFEQLAQNLYPTKDAVSGQVAAVDNEARLKVASELMDNMVAGTETTGWTLTYLLYELSKHADLQSTLRVELLSVASPILISSKPCEIPHPRILDSLPLLEAIILETLRLHPAVAGPQPRVTPQSPISLGEYTNIPSGIRVSAQAYTLHRNAQVFPDPETWMPERWIKASKPEKDEMMRWFWAFGSGARMCTGSHFALLGKLLTALFLFNA